MGNVLMGVIINAYNILVAKSQGNEPLWRWRHRWTFKKQVVKVWVGFN
jgi:hypothetical protein